jgi:hypothetical protein
MAENNRELMPPHWLLTNSANVPSGREAIPNSVILTPVVGIQRPDVRRVKKPFQLKDLSWLDARHKGEHDGGNWVPG